MKQMKSQAEKLEQTLNWLLGLSVALLGLSSAVMSIAALAGLTLPDPVTRALGLASLLSLPVLVYSTVKKALNARRAAASPPRGPGSRGPGRTKKKKKKK